MHPETCFIFIFQGWLRVFRFGALRKRAHILLRVKPLTSWLPNTCFTPWLEMKAQSHTNRKIDNRECSALVDRHAEKMRLSK